MFLFYSVGNLYAFYSPIRRGFLQSGERSPRKGGLQQYGPTRDISAVTISEKQRPVIHRFEK